nr:SGNH hydrolase domain-containing protein [Pseudoxanthomonas sp. PXM02]
MDAPRGDPAGRPVDHVEWYTPAAAQAVRDIPQAYGDDCQLSVEETSPKTCIYGKPDGKTTVAVVGDSKIVQWMPALELLAHQHDWKIVLHGKSSCGFHSRPLTLNGKPYTQCTEWNRAVLDRLLTQDKPDVLITSHGRGSRQINEKEVAALLDWWTPLAAKGTKIIAIANNPHPRGNVYECVAENAERLTVCAFPRNTGSGTASLEAATKALPGSSFINMNDAICPDKLCAPIIGNVLIYRQGSHVTRTYIESMAPRLERELRAAGLD